MTFCAECGANVPEGISFCTECGKPINKKTVPVEAAVSQPEQYAPHAQTQFPQYTSQVQTQPMATYIPQIQQETVVAAYDPPIQQQPAAVYAQHPQYEQPIATAHQYLTPTFGATKPAPGSEYSVMSVGAYIGNSILFSIPLIGWIICLVTAISSKKINKRNFARAMMVFLIIGIILAVAIYFVLGWAAGLITDALNEANASGGLNSPGGNVKPGISVGETAPDNSGGSGGILDEVLGGLEGIEGLEGTAELAELEGLLGELEGLLGLDGMEDYEGLGALGDLFGALGKLGGSEGE